MTPLKKTIPVLLLSVLLPLFPLQSVAHMPLTDGSTKFAVSNEDLIATAPIITNGLLPTIGKKYTYYPSFEETGEKTTYKLLKSPGFAELLTVDGLGYAFIETNDAFEMGVANSGVFFFSLAYPMKQTSSIIDTDYGFDGTNTHTKVHVLQTAQTIKTPAGTFKNVVMLEYPNGFTLYIAKGYGIIKATNAKSETTIELVNVK